LPVTVCVVEQSRIATMRDDVIDDVGWCSDPVDETLA